MKASQKFVPCDYIESGCFQGGEEDVSTARIDYGEECFAISAKQVEIIRAALQDIYDNADNCSDGAPDASPHDKLCNELAGALKPILAKFPAAKRKGAK